MTCPSINKNHWIRGVQTFDCYYTNYASDVNTDVCTVYYTTLQQVTNAHRFNREHWMPVKCSAQNTVHFSYSMRACGWLAPSSAQAKGDTRVFSISQEHLQIESTHNRACQEHFTLMLCTRTFLHVSCMKNTWIREKSQHWHEHCALYNYTINLFYTFSGFNSVLFPPVRVRNPWKHDKSQPVLALRATLRSQSFC